MDKTETIAYIRALGYVIEAMLLALHGSMRKDKIHRYMYYTLSVVLLFVAIGSTLRTSGSEWADPVLDYAVTPVLMITILITAVNIWRVRKTL